MTYTNIIYLSKLMLFLNKLSFIYIGLVFRRKVLLVLFFFIKKKYSPGETVYGLWDRIKQICFYYSFIGKRGNCFIMSSCINDKNISICEVKTIILFLKYPDHQSG
jgi:hypothetical protein